VPVVAGGHEQALAADVRAHAPRLWHELQAAVEVGNVTHGDTGYDARRLHNPGDERSIAIPTVTRSIVMLPDAVREPYEVYVNGVAQQLGSDYQVKGRTLMFERELRKDRISKRRWLLGAWGVGTYKQDDSVDVRYEAADGSPRVAEGLEIELA
jgi:hypothetical protein